MKLTIEGIGELKFSFEHAHRQHTNARCEFNGKTFVASAHLAKCDRFVKAKGRRLALTRLLKYGLQELVPCEQTVEHPGLMAKWSHVLIFTREMRYQVWATYFAQHADLGKKAEVVA